MVSFTGGSRVGWVNATWPFAKLTVDGNVLTFRTGLRTIRFTREDVVAVVPFRRFGRSFTGVQIAHKRADVPELVVFWALQPRRVMEAIARSGFEPSSPSEVPLPERPFPFRIPFIAAVVILWNLLLLKGHGILDGAASPDLGSPYVFSATFMLFAIAMGILAPTPVRTLALRPRVSVGRVLGPLRLVALISAVLCIVHGFALFQQ